MKNSNIHDLNKELSAAITVALRKFHKQERGVRVIEVSVTPDPLNPPGVFYNIKIAAQVTYDINEENPQE